MNDERSGVRGALALVVLCWFLPSLSAAGFGCGSEARGAQNLEGSLPEPERDAPAQPEAADSSNQAEVIDAQLDEPASDEPASDSGDAAAGSASGAFPVECDAGEATSSESMCELRGNCEGQEQRVDCISLTGEWQCTCSRGPSFALGGITLDGVGDEPCRRALGYCPLTLAEYECSLDEPRLEEDLCLQSGSCDYDALDASGPVTSTQGFHAYCRPIGEQWACVCSGARGAYRFRLVPEAGESLAEACPPAVDVCVAGSEPAPSTPSDCVVYGVTASETACRISSLCSDQPEAFGGRSIAAQRIHGVECQQDGAGWACTCQSEEEADSLPAAEPFFRRSELPPAASPCVDHLTRACGGIFD